MIQIQNYDLFIFDFDGTLINTEYFHYEAYIIAISHKINKSIEELKKILIMEGLTRWIKKSNKNNYTPD